MFIVITLILIHISFQKKKKKKDIPNMKTFPD